MQDFPPSGGRWQISTVGGVEPHWRADGRELFYAFGNAIWSVEVDGRNVTLKSGAPKKLFDTPGLNTANFATRYDVAPDGQRFLLDRAPGGITNATNPIRVVLNWPARVR